MIKYAYGYSQSRGGEFEFLCSNQSHWSSSERSVREQAEEGIVEHMFNYDPPLTRKEAEEEMGKPIIYRLDVTVLK